MKGGFKKKESMVTIANLIPDDRDAKSRTTTVNAADVHKMGTD